MPTTEQVRAVVDRYCAAVGAAAKDAILACFSDDASVVDPYPSPACVGRDAIATFWDGVFALGTPVTFQPLKLVICADRAVFIFSMEIETGDGSRFGFEGFDVMTVDDAGLISDHTGYWDLADLHPVGAA